jgi:hypothetical protein
MWFRDVLLPCLPNKFSVPFSIAYCCHIYRLFITLQLFARVALASQMPCPNTLHFLRIWQNECCLVMNLKVSIHIICVNSTWSRYTHYTLRMQRRPPDQPGPGAYETAGSSFGYQVFQKSMYLYIHPKGKILWDKLHNHVVASKF